MQHAERIAEILAGVGERDGVGGGEVEARLGMLAEPQLRYAQRFS